MDATFKTGTSLFSLFENSLNPSKADPDRLFDPQNQLKTNSLGASFYLSSEVVHTYESWNSDDSGTHYAYHLNLYKPNIEAFKKSLAALEQQAGVPQAVIQSLQAQLLEPKHRLKSYDIPNTEKFEFSEIDEAAPFFPKGKTFDDGVERETK